MKYFKISFSIFLIFSFFSPTFGQIDSSFLEEKSPRTFKAEFKTTKGTFTIKAYRKWSPLGVDRFYQLIKKGYYNNNGIFRVQPDYVVQFGVSNDPEINKFISQNPIKDEPLKKKNKTYTISFARGGPDTRSNSVFINLNNNVKLDTINFMNVVGFTPIAKIIEGEQITETFYSGYGFEPTAKQDSMMERGNIYWEENYPLIDYIIEAKILDK